MGFTALRCGAGVSAIFLKDGARMVGARSALVDDFAVRAVRAMAQRVFTSTSKKFSRTTFSATDHVVSAWDIYCHGRFRNSAFRDKLISDFILMSLTNWINEMSDEMRWLIEMSATNSAHVEEDEVLSREIVLAVMHAEVNRLVVDYGRSLQAFYERYATYQPIRNGASPA